MRCQCFAAAGRVLAVASDLNDLEESGDLEQSGGAEAAAGGRMVFSKTPARSLNTSQHVGF
jgi:hypothetical protein